MSVTLVELENGQLADAKQVMENFNALRAAVEEAVSPYAAGDLKLSAATSVASGWFACEGQAVSRTTYKTLFEAIGTAYGEGDKATTFNVPDYRERVPVGIGGAYTRGSKGGAATVALTTANLAAHKHGVTDPSHGHGITDGGHVHSLGGATALTIGSGVEAYASGAATTGGITQTGGTYPGGVNVTVNSAATGISTNNEGSGTAHANVQPYTTCGVWIKH